MHVNDIIQSIHVILLWFEFVSGISSVISMPTTPHPVGYRTHNFLELSFTIRKIYTTKKSVLGTRRGVK